MKLFIVKCEDPYVILGWIDSHVFRKSRKLWKLRNYKPIKHLEEDASETDPLQLKNWEDMLTNLNQKKISSFVVQCTAESPLVH